MYEGAVQDLIDELGMLPGIGPKSAQRIAFHLLSVEPPDIDRLTAVLNRVRDDLADGFAALPIWMQDLLRDLVAPAAAGEGA